jgi:hypothetical protein
MLNRSIEACRQCLKNAWRPIEGGRAKGAFDELAALVRDVILSASFRGYSL